MQELIDNKAERLHKIEKMIDSFEMKGAKNFVEAGLHWKSIKESELWKAGGTHLKSFADYIQDRGRKIATVYNQILITTEIEDYDLIGCDYTKLLEIARAKKRYKLSPETVRELIEGLKVKQIPYSGFMDNLRNAIGVIATDECEHKETEMFSRCKLCHKWLKE